MMTELSIEQPNNQILWRLFLSAIKISKITHRNMYLIYTWKITLTHTWHRLSFINRK